MTGGRLLRIHSCRGAYLLEVYDSVSGSAIYNEEEYRAVAKAAKEVCVFCVLQGWSLIRWMIKSSFAF